MKKTVWTLAVAALFMPVLTLAISGLPADGGPVCDRGVLRNAYDPGCITRFQNIDSVGYLLLFLLSILRTIFWILAVGMIFFAAYLYLFGGAGEKNVDAAKRVIRYAIIAMVIALIATAIPLLVRSFIGG